MKDEVEKLDGTPEKRLFWSIISDYGLLTAICELIDNAIDIWVANRKVSNLEIKVILDHNRQRICVEDNAGGVKKQNLRLLIAPGGSSNDPSDEIIGVFGVGSKRAGVALGETIKIQTRYENNQTYQLDVSKEWLESEEWEMPIYEIDEISEGTTIIQISDVRRSFSETDVEVISKSLSEIYGKFICNKCSLIVNDKSIVSSFFDNWAYPENYPPKRAIIELDSSEFIDEEDGVVVVEITGGLIFDRIPENENYGAYFYCNDRLVAKELKDREVGYYNSNEAGVPHPDGSLARVIIKISGSARAMPWNSSKSSINFDHPIFQKLRPAIVSQMSFYSKLSRRMKNDWEQEVFPKKIGIIEDVDSSNLGASFKIVQPALPKTRKKYLDQLVYGNSEIIRKEPWTLGLVEALGAVEIIKKQKFQTKNRISLIVLDSNFEIALKEFIVHRDDLFPPKKYHDQEIAKIFKNRTEVIGHITSKVKINGELLKKVSHYYTMRNKLIHERATLSVTDYDIETYRETIHLILNQLFGLKF